MAEFVNDVTSISQEGGYSGRLPEALPEAIPIIWWYDSSYRQAHPFMDDLSRKEVYDEALGIVTEASTRHTPKGRSIEFRSTVPFGHAI